VFIRGENFIFTCRVFNRHYLHAEKCLKEIPEFTTSTTTKRIAMEVLTFINRNNNNILLYS